LTNWVDQNAAVKSDLSKRASVLSRQVSQRRSTSGYDLSHQDGGAQHEHSEDEHDQLSHEEDEESSARGRVEERPQVA